MEIEELDSGNFVFETGEPGALDALDGTDVSVEIPADSLVPGRAYRVYLMFVNPTDVDTSSYPDATGIAGYISESKIMIRTADLDSGDATAPSVSASPDGFNGEVPVSSAIAFLFSEPMDTTIGILASIAWTGVDGADFSCTWNSRGDPGWRLLFTTAIEVTACNGGAGPLYFGSANIQLGVGGSFDTLLLRG